MAPPAPGPVRVMAPPRVMERTLPNGLRVIVAKSTNLPIVNVQLRMAGGAAGDPAGQPGLASMTANLATRGAGERSAPEIARTLEALGADMNSGAGADSTSLSLSAPIASADQAGSVFADVVMRPTFAAAELERSRTQTVTGLTVALRDPGTLASQVLSRLAYGGVGLRGTGVGDAVLGGNPDPRPDPRFP